MNAAQKKILYGAVIIFLFSCLYVPWGSQDIPSDGGYLHGFWGWNWLWRVQEGGQLEIRIVLMEWAAILVLAGLLVLAKRKPTLSQAAPAAASASNAASVQPIVRSSPAQPAAADNSSLQPAAITQAAGTSDRASGTSAGPTGWMVAYWVVVMGVCLVAGVGAFVSAQSGTPFDSKSWAGGAWLAVIFCAVDAKKRGRSGWVGAAKGFAGVVGCVFLIGALATIAGSFSKGSPTEQVDSMMGRTQPYPIIKQRFPKEYEAIRQSFITIAKSGKFTGEDATRVLNQGFTSLNVRALKTTSDPALLMFAAAKLKTLQDVAKHSPDACNGVLTGTFDSSVNMIQVAAYISPETKAQNQQALQKVFEDANARQDAPAAEQPLRLNALYAQLDRTMISKYSLSADIVADQSLNAPAEARCRAGIALLDEIMNLPSNDRAFMLQWFFGF